MAGFDEEKKKLLETGDIISKSYYVWEFLSRYSLDSDTAASTCVALSTASSVASLKLPDVTKHKILMTVKDIEKGVNTILKTPLKTALENFDFILDAVESTNFEIAFEKNSVFEEDAMKAFHYMDRGNHISKTNYIECSKAAKLHMFAIILRSSYDRDRKVFISPQRLQENQVLLIGNALEKIARKCIGQKKHVKTKSWGFEKEKKKTEAQKCLNQILKLAYPYISRAKKLTDLNKKLTMSEGEHYKFHLLPELLPIGFEEKTEIIVGIKTTDNQGEKSPVKFGVFRTEDNRVAFHDGIRIHLKPIISESKPVFMEDAVCPWPCTVSASGWAKEKCSWLLGDFIITKQEHSGKPVFRSRGGHYLFSLEGGAWAVGLSVDDGEPVMRSTSAAPSPTLCPHWQYSANTLGGAPWKDGDITVKIKI